MNILADLLGLPFAESRYQPFLGISILLCIVTTGFAVAKWDNVAWEGAGAIWRGKRHPMISRKSMKQTRGAATSRTATAKVIYSGLPVGISKVCGQCGASSGVTLAYGLPFLWVSLLPFGYTPHDSTAVLSVVFTVADLQGWLVAFSVLALRFFSSWCLLVHLDPTLNLLWVFQVLIARIVHIAIRISVTPFLLFQPVTHLALRAQAVFIALVACEILGCCGVFVAAKRTAFHEVFPYWPYRIEAGKAVRLAFQAVHDAALSLNHYTMNRLGAMLQEAYR